MNQGNADTALLSSEVTAQTVPFFLETFPKQHHAKAQITELSPFDHIILFPSVG